LTLGAGVTPAANTNRFGGSAWWDTGDTATTTLAEAVAGNDYIEFIVTPNAGAKFTPTSLVFSWDRSATGPGTVTLRSSVDGFTADLGTLSLAASLTTGNTINISGLTNLSTATTFRLYGYGGTAAGGTGGFDTSISTTNVVLNGTSSAPTAAEVALGGRVLTASNRGVMGARITVIDPQTGAQRTVTSNPFGAYYIDGLQAGRTYVVSIAAARLRFSEAAKTVTVTDSLTSVNFVASP
jgi:hypothetical protein